MASDDKMRVVVSDFIIAELLSPEDAPLLAGDTRLITGGILDSISTARLVSFLEERFGIQLESHEVSVKRLDTIDRIVQTLEEKL